MTTRSSHLNALSGEFNHAAEIRNDVHLVSTNWHINRCPLVSRVPRLPVGATTFSMISRQAGRPSSINQHCQTWRCPVQLCSSSWASLPYPSSPPARTPFDQNKMDALQNLMDDMETSSYYGKGEDPAMSGRPKQKGLRTLLRTNNTVSPANHSDYKATDFIRDTLQRCRDNGGDPGVLLLSSNFMTGLAIWGHAVHRLDAGTNVFGTPIDIFEAPFLGGVSIIEAPLLKPFTAICLTSFEVRLRMKRNEFWSPGGIRGYSIEGEWIAEGAIEVENERHHAWLEGITGFSAA